VDFRSLLAHLRLTSASGSAPAGERKPDADSGPAGYRPRADFVFILGMHRCGTSCLAGSLERCGLYLGDVFRQSRFNARGNHELKAAMDLHNQILEASGGSWDAPPGRIRLGPEQRSGLARIAAELYRHPPCGLKDPRLLLLLEEWLPIAGEVAGGFTMVGTYRHPMAAVASLAARNGFSAEQSLRLWLRYNEKMVDWHRRCGFPLIEFDLASPEMYLGAIHQLAGRLGLVPDRARLAEFVTAELDHRPKELGEVPPDCRPLYGYLCQHRLAPDVAATRGIEP